MTKTLHMLPVALYFVIAVITLVSGVLAIELMIWHNHHGLSILSILLKIFLSGVTLLTAYNIVKLWWKG